MTKDGTLYSWRDARKARREGANGIARRQRERLAELVAYARARSPYYEERYRDLPARVEDVRLLPVTNKKQLMARFDDWTTDRDVTLERARTFAADPDLVGKPFVGKYTLVTTSGTTGTPGIFLLDERTHAVTNAIALVTVSRLRFHDWRRLLAKRGRMAMVMATGGHFASAVGAALLRRTERGRRRVGVFPATTPMSQLVEQLNAFEPGILAPYASVAQLLAIEQEEGRLHIHPVLIAISAEGLPPEEYDRIARTFQAEVLNSYAASECTFLSANCDEGWLHVNADWAILEPVDAHHEPVAPGTTSHTVLLTNLANRLQPVIRYDLGDSVVQRPDACPCGSPLPAIRVQGRAADVLTVLGDRDGRVRIPPLAFSITLEGLPGIESYQIVQLTPTRLRFRFLVEKGANPEAVWEGARGAIARLLAKHGASNLEIERAQEPPERTPGAKLRQVVPLANPQ
jgi:phenylacetate-CoA ligase